MRSLEQQADEQATSRPPACLFALLGATRAAGRARAELWQFSRKWTAAAGALGPSTRVLLLPGRAPQPLRVVRRAALEGRLRALLASAPGTALGLVGLETAEAAFVRSQPLHARRRSTCCWQRPDFLCVQLCTNP